MKLGAAVVLFFSLAYFFVYLIALVVTFLIPGPLFLIVLIGGFFLGAIAWECFTVAIAELRSPSQTEHSE